MTPTTSSPQFVVCIDAAFLRPCAALLKSISIHQRQRSHIFVVGSELKVSEIRCLRDIARPHLLTFIDGSELIFQEVKSPPHLSRAAYLRLLVPRLFKDEVILYLDADTLVTRDLSHLFQLKFDCPIAATEDQLVQTFKNSAVGSATNSRGDLSRYFNSGVMLINVESFNSVGVDRLTLELLAKNYYPYGDQDALNLVLKDNWEPLPGRYNVQTAGYLGRPTSILSKVLHRLRISFGTAVVHFTGPKPWLSEKSVPRRWLFRLYFFMTLPSRLKYPSRPEIVREWETCHIE